MMVYEGLDGSPIEVKGALIKDSRDRQPPSGKKERTGSADTEEEVCSSQGPLL